MRRFLRILGRLLSPDLVGFWPKAGPDDDDGDDDDADIGGDGVDDDRRAAPPLP